jgi:hypothetical protein
MAQTFARGSMDNVLEVFGLRNSFSCASNFKEKIYFRNINLVSFFAPLS